MSSSWRAPTLWRILLMLARWCIPLLCRLRITGTIPPNLVNKPLILAGNHIGLFDPVALTAACGRRGYRPRILTTAGVLRAPLVGAVLRSCGHIAVDRKNGGVAALDHAVTALRAGAMVAVYPEGRITLDPGGWPERPKTGVARLAFATDAAVIPVSQWGAHEMVVYHGVGASIRRLLSALWRRPTVHVHFGKPITASELRRYPSPQLAANHVMHRIREDLAALRVAEPGLPAHIDHSRPLSTARALVAES
ncbi:MAG: 1-acyl-sn-glycerol-3-phosphate acyltransferase [Corynebacteriales bacterium]|nr:1-acyl-sn-glycerol-3-phosphate acyltransferase [Mycobacteriales bacterium]